MSKRILHKHSSNFADRVRAAVARIPRGEVRTYAQIARAAGSPRACRAVGNVLSNNYDPAVPCHRVIRADGTPGGYNRGADRKLRILAREGYALSEKTERL